MTYICKTTNFEKKETSQVTSLSCLKHTQSITPPKSFCTRNDIILIGSQQTNTYKNINKNPMQESYI